MRTAAWLSRGAAARLACPYLANKPHFGLRSGERVWHPGTLMGVFGVGTLLASALSKARGAGDAVSYRLVLSVSGLLSCDIRLGGLLQLESRASLSEVVREMVGNAEVRPDIGKLRPGQYGEF